MAFLMLIGSNNLRQSRRELLQRLFTEFRQNLEESFWSDHTLKISTRITTKQTAIAVQKSGTKQAQVEYQRFITCLEKDALSEEHEDDPDDNKNCSEHEDNDSVSGSETPKKNEAQLKRSGFQQKRKATAFLVDFKDATFPAPVTPAPSVIHSDFEGFRERSKAIARTSPLDFATQKAESLALNGIWFIGKTALRSVEAKAVSKAMSHAYRFTECSEILALTPSLSEILQSDNAEQEISEAIDQLSSADMSWKARRALKVWRHLNNQLLKGNTEHESASEYKTDHKHGVRSDFFVALPFPHLGMSCVGLIGEVKPPEKAQIEQLELHDQWKLFRMMKSEIDSQIKKGIPEPVVWGCQIFGYDLTLYVMDMRVPQVYCLLKVFTGTLPKSIEDLSGECITKRVSELEKLNTLLPPDDSRLLTQPNQATPKKHKAM
ncbi:hypothetical protein EC957_007712 [Mortierella hygrophila]|uniref:Uncharacterized protein n=1 Tax=Mortierella hygrophila TaxID=979708 RepID=A0A9P6EXV4_9FUNG|nr:hypothetical protein EC957_007712 [Mortierella hygrophila]